MQMSEDSMAFPNTWEEFEKEYGFTDTDEIYTNGSRLIQSFRVEQWLEHLDAVPVIRGGRGKMMVSEEFILIWGRISQFVIITMVTLGYYVVFDFIRECIHRRKKNENQ